MPDPRMRVRCWGLVRVYLRSQGQEAMGWARGPDQRFSFSSQDRSDGSDKKTGSLQMKVAEARAKCRNVNAGIDVWDRRRSALARWEGKASQKRCGRPSRVHKRALRGLVRWRANGAPVFCARLRHSRRSHGRRRRRHSSSDLHSSRPSRPPSCPLCAPARHPIPPHSYRSHCASTCFDFQRVACGPAKGGSVPGSWRRRAPDITWRLCRAWGEVHRGPSSPRHSRRNRRDSDPESMVPHISPDRVSCVACADVREASQHLW